MSSVSKYVYEFLYPTRIWTRFVLAFAGFSMFVALWVAHHDAPQWALLSLVLLFGWIQADNKRANDYAAQTQTSDREGRYVVLIFLPAVLFIVFSVYEFAKFLL